MMQWSLPYSWMVYAALAAGLCALLWAARRWAISPKLQSWLLLAPRAVVLAVLLLVLLGPIRRSEEQLPPRQPSVAYLIDCSESMALDRPESRLDRVRRTIAEADRLLPAGDRPRVQWFRFGEGLSAAAGMSQLDASDPATELRPALEQLPSRLSQDAPRAVVVFSDGATDAEGLAELAAGYRQMKLPLCVLPVGDLGVRGDVAIEQVHLPGRVEGGDKVAIRVDVRQHGFDSERAVLQIRAGTPDQRVLASLPLSLQAGVQTSELVVEADPDVPSYVLEIAPLEGEAVLENNRVPFRLSTRDRKLRVVYLEGTAGNCFAPLRDALVEDPDIQCLAITVNQQYAARPTLQRVDDPFRGYPATREELLQYDVVICSDISQGAFTPEQIAWTVELVADRGGGFAMVGGHTSFGSGGWDSTPWEKLIPFDMTGQAGYLYETFRIDIPPEAAGHPIWRLLEDPEQNRQALAKFPAFFGTNLIARIKPAATLLGQTAAPLSQGAVMPIFGCETYGRGRTFAMSTDTTVDWGRDFERIWGEGGDNRYYRRFWRNVVRWLAEGSIADSRRLHVATDKLIYRPGEAVAVTAEAFDAEMRATTAYQVSARVLPPAAAPAKGGTEAALTAALPEVLYRGEVPARIPRPDGGAADVELVQTARLQVTASDSGGAVATSVVEFQIMHDSEELRDPRPVPKTLIGLAEAGGGRVLADGAELAALLREFPSTPGEVVTHTTPVWSRPWLWALLLGLLVVEWSARRRAGLG